MSRAALLYSIAAIVSRAIRGEGVDLSFEGYRLGREAPMLEGVPVALWSAAAAPCIRQTLCPRTAGDRHGFPLRFDLAWHLNAWCIGQCMGLFSGFFVRPSPRPGALTLPTIACRPRRRGHAGPSSSARRRCGIA